MIDKRENRCLGRGQFLQQRGSPGCSSVARHDLGIVYWRPGGDSVVRGHGRMDRVES